MDKKPWYKRDLRDFGRLARALVIAAKILLGLLLLYIAIAVFGYVAAKKDFAKQFPDALTGRSMEKTIHQPIQLGRFSFGALLWIDRTAVRTLDSIVLFWTPDGQLSVKRIAKVFDRAGVKSYWLEPDNLTMNGSGEGSGFGTYKEIADSRIVGVVSWVWTVRRAIRSFTFRGRFTNRMEFNYPSNRVTFSPSGTKVLVELTNGTFKFADASGRITGEMRPVKKPRGADWVNNEYVAMQVTNGYIYMWPDGRWKRTLEFPDAGSLSYTMRLGKSALPGYEKNKKEQRALEALNPGWSETPEGIVLGVVYMGPPITLNIADKKVGLGGVCTLVGGAEYHVFPKPVKGGDIWLGQVDVVSPFLLYAVKQ